MEWPGSAAEKEELEAKNVGQREAAAPSVPGPGGGLRFIYEGYPLEAFVIVLFRLVRRKEGPEVYPEMVR